MDPRTGEIGVAETTLPAGLASWLAGAPPVPRGALDAVASKLSGVGPQTPVPRLRRVAERTGVSPEPVLTRYGHERNVRLYGPGRFGRRSPRKA